MALQINDGSVLLLLTPNSLFKTFLPDFSKQKFSVADLDPGGGAFLTPSSGITFRIHPIFSEDWQMFLGLKIRTPIFFFAYK
jgi:hypothetical protein